ncbi:MAG: flagellar biosynthesis protein FlhA [Gammaproteobacteria bacterium]|nr:flagellar biosynthesis protein FlhA [Gammaproteobacteria bacterium]
MQVLRKVLGKQGDLVLVVLITFILMLLFVPIPSWMLDFLLITNFSFALLILLLTFYMGKPLEFSTFPSLLLIATLFRLGLNVSATRLILGAADAGHVIGAIGEFVVSGNYVIGLIVFLVLIVVQYVVVTNGAQRVAEVAARFTLDSMPGKQMAIDADLNMGLIDQNEARERRKNVEREANFYGAMDGASRFVKGDAIAGILIVLINIVGGLAIGVSQMGMSWGDALQTYTLLTIGDGIVTQVPALIIATATGIIVTRAATDAQLSDEVAKQVTAYPKTILLVGAGLVALLFLPGIPLLPVLVLLTITSLLFWFAFRAWGKRELETADAGKAASGDAEDLYGLLTVEPIEVSIGQNLIPLVGGDNSLFMERIVAFRKQCALDAGFVFPKVRVKDNKKHGPNHYQVAVYGTKVAEGEIVADRLLAISPNGERGALDGVPARDPTYGLPAVWIVEDQRKRARDAGYTVVDPATVMLTHLTEVIKQQSPNLLTRAETERIIGRVREQQASLIEELIPKVLAVGEVQKVLQNLLREKVSIRNIEAILEVLSDFGGRSRDPELLTEHVRERLGASICQSLTNTEGELYVLTLDPSIEQAINGSIRAVDEKATLVLEPKLAEQLLRRIAGEVEKMMSNNMMPVVLCSPVLRRHLRRFTERVMPQLSVLSLSEIPNNVNLKAYGMVSV